MSSIKWGIIGCGNVTEIKSGPAFNKVKNSSLTAVMRRDGEKAKDYALRHKVSKWYDDAQKLIDDPEVNAIYVATPPLYHEEYTIASLRAGKPVYVEKPMAFNEAACLRMLDASVKYKTKLSVAHYKRAQPIFNKVKEMLEAKVIGEIRFISLQMLQAPQSNVIAKTDVNWRVDPKISGGGLFHDLAPHQFDLMLYYFGKVKKVSGLSGNQAGLYSADDIVSAELLFENNIIFKGLWCFTVPENEAKDVCEIIGSKGKISFPIFGSRIILNKNNKEEIFQAEPLEHVQQPMIEKVVNYFLDKEENPCSAEQGVEVMKIMDKILSD